MKKICALMVIGLFLGIAPRVWAFPPVEPADVGTKICRDIQLVAQEVAGEEEDWHNHGARVSAASDVVKPLKESEIITPECASCIMKQFARRIAIDDQEDCGPDRVCGDGEVDPGEECDDGNDVNDDECTNFCTLPRCGDGITQPDLGEECDDGNIEPGDGCNEFCEIEILEPLGACCILILGAESTVDVQNGVPFDCIDDQTEAQCSGPDGFQVQLVPNTIWVPGATCDEPNICEFF